MKKIGLTVVVSLMAVATQAQNHENFDPFKDRDFLFDALHISTMLIAIYLIASFILQIFKAGMTARIKNRMLDKGTEENIVKRTFATRQKRKQKLYPAMVFYYGCPWYCFLTSHANQPFRITFSCNHCI